MAIGRKSPKLKESTLETQILIYLSRLKVGFFWKNISTGFFDGSRWRKQASPFAINGTPDIIGIINGRFVGIEVKTIKGRLTEAQELFARKAQEVGGVCFVARSCVEAHKQLQVLGLLGDLPAHAPAIEK
jgi:hypothetical protein